MTNELLLTGSVIFIFSMTLAAYRLFGKAGLYCLSAIATVLANIEVLLLIDAFGMEQTLGNVLFAVTFLITDILSECEGKKEANRAVWIGIFSSLFFLLLSQSWLLYLPAGGGSGHALPERGILQYSQDAGRFPHRLRHKPAGRCMALS